KAIAVGHSAVSRPEHRNGSATARSGRSRSSRWGKPICRTWRSRPLSQAPRTDAGPSSSWRPIPYWPGRWWRLRISRRSTLMQEPWLLAEAAAQGLDVDPVSGAEIAALVDRLYGTPPEVLELVRKINASR